VIFVDAEEHRGLRRVEVEADHVEELVDEQWIGGYLELSTCCR
jgi:hypothetical protein